MLAPVGTSPAVPSSRLNINVCTGISLSVAVAVKVRVSNSSISWSPIGSKTGAKFTSYTATVIVSQTIAMPSLTQTSKVFPPGPWASVGVQVNTPVEGLMLAPVGTWPAVPSCKLKVKIFAGISASVAVAMKVNSMSSSVALFPIGPRTGATLTSFTVTVMVSQSLSAPSLTQTSNVYTPGP